MSGYTHTHDMAIALTLPHLRTLEERTAFLADHTAMAAINTYGRAAVTDIFRKLAGLFRDPAFVAGSKVGIEQSIISLGMDPALAAKAKEAIDVIHNAATNMPGEVGDQGAPDRPMPNWKVGHAREPEFMYASDESIAATPDGALVLVKKHTLLSAGPVTPDMDEVTMRVVHRPWASDSVGLKFPAAARLLAVIPTAEGHKLSLDTEVPTSFSPGSYLRLKAEALMALSDDAINGVYHLDETVPLGLSILRVDETGQIQAVVTASYRPYRPAVSETTSSTAAPQVEGEPAAATTAESTAAQAESVADPAPPVSGVRKRRTKVDGATPKKPRSRRV